MTYPYVTHHVTSRAIF